MLGVNSDEDREAIKKICVDENLTWRSWWDGAIDGPIHTKWQITERPATFILDDQGIIRYRNISTDDLDAAIEALLAEVD